MYTVSYVMSVHACWCVLRSSLVRCWLFVNATRRLRHCEKFWKTRRKILKWPLD